MTKLILTIGFRVKWKKIRYSRMNYIMDPSTKTPQLKTIWVVVNGI